MCGIFATLGKHLDSLSEKEINSLFNSFKQLKNRGPTSSNFMSMDNDKIHVGFSRLAINDTSMLGMQPFIYEEKDRKIVLLCNGEIYNHELLTQMSRKFYTLQSKSDCECLMNVYVTHGIERMLSLLKNNEFAFVILDIKYSDKNLESVTIYAARDLFGRKPLYYSIDEKVCFASIIKAIPDYKTKKVEEVSQGSYISMHLTKDSFNVIKREYYSVDKYPAPKEIGELTDLYEKIIDTMITTVNDRLMSDVPIGCLLSGGLDSSLVAALAQQELSRQNKKLYTYSIGFEGSPDLKAAQIVAKHINSCHTSIIIDAKQCIDAIPRVIKTIETYDTTTVRASIPQLLMSEYITKNTDTTVFLTGEGSDEMWFGYLLFHYAPNPTEALKESIKKLKYISKYDVTRMCKATSEKGIEARPVFLDERNIEVCMSIPPALKMPMKMSDMEHYKQIDKKDNKDEKKLEKGILRNAFYVCLPNLLPVDILMRRKDAFSDAITDKSKSLFEYIKEHTEKLITDQEFKTESKNYTHNPPVTKEMLYYRKIFEENFGSKNSELLPEFWHHTFTNQQDPSARLLSVY